MKYAKEQRLRMIDFLLANYGYVNRTILMDYFDTGPAGSTRDFKTYKEMAPNNMVFNDSKKSYYKTDCFERVWA